MENLQEGTAVPVEEVAPTPVAKKKAAPKNAPPSDKTVIANLKKELAEANKHINNLSLELETQQNKNITVFNKYQEVAKELENQRVKFSNSKTALLQTIDGALRAFTNN